MPKCEATTSPPTGDLIGSQPCKVQRSAKGHVAVDTLPSTPLTSSSSLFSNRKGLQARFDQHFPQTKPFSLTHHILGPSRSWSYCKLKTRAATSFRFRSLAPSMPALFDDSGLPGSSEGDTDGESYRSRMAKHNVLFYIATTWQNYHVSSSRSSSAAHIRFPVET